MGKILSILLLLLFLKFNSGYGQMDQDLKQPGAGNGGVFVVTNRVTDTIPGVGIHFLNIAKPDNGLKYLKVSDGPDGLHAVSYDNLALLMEQPAPYTHWAVWVHGDGQSFELSVKRALELQELHRVNILVFAWPTKAPDRGPIGNFRNSLKNVPATAPKLGSFLGELQDYRNIPGNQMAGDHLSVFFHSLGGYLLKQTVDGGFLADIRPGLFDNLVINASATEAEGHRDWVERLELQKRLFITYNDEDINLEGLRALSSLGTQLGERPVGMLAGNATYLDFTRSVGFRFPTGATHSYYFATMTRISENIRKTYTELFQGLALPLEEKGRFSAVQGSIWVYDVHF